jgi:hypothetical protein
VEPRQVVDLTGPFLIEELGDAEVEQLRAAFGGDQDVGGFDVAVNDQMLMGILDSRADLLEQAEPPADVQPVLVAVTIETDSVDVFHRQVRHTVFARTPIEQAGDVGVIQVGQDLPFGPEPARQGAGGHQAVDELDRDLLLELLVSALCQVDGAHAATTQCAQDTVTPDQAPRRHVFDFGPRACDCAIHARVERGTSLRRAGQQAENLVLQCEVIAAAFRQPAVELARVESAGLFEQFPDTLRTRLGHPRCLGHACTNPACVVLVAGGQDLRSKAAGKCAGMISRCAASVPSRCRIVMLAGESMALNDSISFGSCSAGSSSCTQRARRSTL